MPTCVALVSLRWGRRGVRVLMRKGGELQAVDLGLAFAHAVFAVRDRIPTPAMQVC